MSRQDPEKLVSTAAYLLFYRRRSSQPLGPPYLQELVNKARNPIDGDSAEASDADSESGEGGRLGDRSSASSRLPGSSSAGTVGAGAAPGTSQRLLLPGVSDAGHGSGANRAAMLRETSEDEGISLEHDDLGPTTAINYLPAQTWGFDNLDDADGDINTNTPADTASMAAASVTSDTNDRLTADFGDEDNTPWGDAPQHEGAWNGNANEDFFSDAREHQGMIDGEDSDPPVHNINSDD